MKLYKFKFFKWEVWIFVLVFQDLSGSVVYLEYLSVYMEKTAWILITDYFDFFNQFVEYESLLDCKEIQPVHSKGDQS